MAEGGRTHVIPNSINYSDVKPEQIENTVKLVRFTPTANVQSASPNDVIKFMLQGNGFLDPFSTYIDIEVDIMPELSTMSATEPRVIIPNSGTLDLTASEQDQFTQRARGPHYQNWYESQVNHSEMICYGKYLDRSAHSFIHRFVARSQGEELERIEEYDVLAAMVNDMLYSREQKKIHFNEGFPHSTMSGGGNPALFNGDGNTYIPTCGRGDQGSSIYSQTTAQLYKDNLFPTSSSPLHSMTVPQIYNGRLIQNTPSGSTVTAADSFGIEENNFVSRDSLTNATNLGMLTTENDPTPLPNVTLYKRSSSHLKRFTIPIYSGIIGVLIPEKKLIPLNLMPLELEFTMNPHALYAMRPNPNDNVMTRNYNITKFEIYGNVIMFEQQVHRALDQVVAQQGLYIPFNTFYLAPQAVNTGAAETQITAFSQINVYFKSINSIHTVFIYSGYRTNVGQRKLHFVSHRLTSLQLRNGTEFTPSERILGDMGNGQVSGQGNAFYIETLKSFNKLHDPATDAAFETSNYFNDNLATAIYYGPKTILDLHTHQAMLGRCQYGISLEGEEMGKDKTTLSGRKGMQPFDLMQVGTKTMSQGSNQLIFVRADMVVFVRQDLVVQLLGR